MWPLSPGPLPRVHGGHALQVGKREVNLPFPPYCVPRSENSAVFCEMAKSWPLHIAQPRRGKIPGEDSDLAQKWILT